MFFTMKDQFICIQWFWFLLYCTAIPTTTKCTSSNIRKLYLQLVCTVVIYVTVYAILHISHKHHFTLINKFAMTWNKLLTSNETVIFYFTVTSVHEKCLTLQDVRLTIQCFFSMANSTSCTGLPKTDNILLIFIICANFD